MATSTEPTVYVDGVALVTLLRVPHFEMCADDGAGLVGYLTVEQVEVDTENVVRCKPSVRICVRQR